MIFHKRTVVAATLLLLTAATLPAQSTVAGATLRPGDAVRIVVWQRPDLSGEFTVSSAGRLSHPILQDAVVTGVPFDEATLRLRGLLRQFVGEVQFTVDPLVRVAVGGEVRQPSLYMMEPDMTVGFAVARAGGPTERGRLSRILLIRAGERIEVDVNDPADGWASAALRSGDQVLVLRRTDVLRDYITPLASVTAAVASVIRLLR